MKYWIKQPPEHPLRKKLEPEDWQRIQQVMDGELPDGAASVDEIDAAHDVLYDAVAGKLQTHYGILIMN